MTESKRKNPVLSSSGKKRHLFAFGSSLALSLSLLIAPWGIVAASALDKADPAASTPGAVDSDSDNASDQPFDNVELPQSETLNLLNQAEKLQSHANAPILKGRVISPSGDRRIPILSGSVQNIPPKTEIELVVPPGVFLDSEYSQKGDEVYLRVGKDVLSKDGSKVLLPGEWYMRGLVTRAQKRKRGGRDGIIEVEFDKLVSPDHQYELDINASFSTREKKLKTVAKVVAIDSGYVAAGTGAGALLAWQWGGPALAISTYGISIGVGGAIGATIGAIGAAKRFGHITTMREGHVIKLETEEGLALPEFDPLALPSAEEKPQLAGLDIKVVNFKFHKVPWKDKGSRFLDLDLAVENRSQKVFHFFDLAVEDDIHQNFRPMPSSDMGMTGKKIAPGGTGAGKIRFLVGSPKRKYTLLFFSRRNNDELSSVSIN
ncbi:hypothetical protein GC174_08035 [bacterium]|nr:hypothetical protein [bacterium]